MNGTLKFRYKGNHLICHHILNPISDPADHPVHAHEMMEIFYFISGKGTYLIEGTEYELHPGDILLMRVAETHKLLLDLDVPYERIVFQFAPEILTPLDPKGRLLRPFNERPLGCGNRYTSADFVGDRWRSAYDGLDATLPTEQRANVIARVLTLLVELCIAFDRRQRVTDSSFMTELVSYVNAHLFEAISAQVLSEVFYKSKPQISRLFRRATGISVGEYVKVKRLLAARAMVQRGEPAAAVCTACGFGSYSVFFRAYKEQFGCSPKDDLLAVAANRPHLIDPTPES